VMTQMKKMSLRMMKIMANFLAFASSHKSKSGSEKRKRVKGKDDSSEDDSDVNSTNGYVEKEVLLNTLPSLEMLRDEEPLRRFEDVERRKS
jgi:hypothetical protein